MAGERSAGDTRLHLTTRSRPQAEPAVIEGEVQPLPPNEAAYTFDGADALMRLGGGRVVELLSQLLERIQAWEADAVADPKTLELRRSETGADLARYALIGLLFDGQHRARAGAKTLGGWAASAVGLTAAMARPVLDLPLMGRVRRSGDDLRDQFAAYVIYLIETGRGEEMVGRLMATGLTVGVIDEVIRYFAANEEIGDLVTSQGTSLAGEVVNGVRQRTISGDSIIESVVRGVLRRTARGDLPAPPEAVQHQATPWHTTGTTSTI